MASTTTPYSSPPNPNLEKPKMDSIRLLVASVDRHIQAFLSDPVARRSLHSRCTSELTMTQNHHGFFEFSEHSVLSNLYWGIENVESAIRSDCPSERASRLESAERMLQIPALLGEEGRTTGIENRFLVSCSYFYLSLVRKLQSDEPQMTMHFLQATIVSPRHVRVEFAPEIWGRVFVGGILDGEVGLLGMVSGEEFDEEAVDGATRRLARRYKDWLMYYRVVSYGETPRWMRGRVGDCDGVGEFFDSMYIQSAVAKYLNPVKHGSAWPTFPDDKSAYPLDHQEKMQREKITDSKTLMMDLEEQNSSSLVEDPMLFFKKVDEIFHPDMNESTDIKCLQDMLEESQSDTSVSFYSNTDPSEGSESEEKMHGHGNMMKEELAVADFSTSRRCDRKLQDIPNNTSHTGSPVVEPDYTATHTPNSSENQLEEEAYTMKSRCFIPSRSCSSVDDLNISLLRIKDVGSNTSYDFHEEHTLTKGSEGQNFKCFGQLPSKLLRRYSFPELVSRGSFARIKLNFSNSEKDMSEVSSYYENENQTDVLGRFEKAVSALCFSEGPGKFEAAGLKVSTVMAMLNNKSELKYSLFKQEILNQLLDVISSSKEEKVIRASLSILLTLIAEDRSVIEDIKKKKMYLHDLASVLKRNVYEAVVIIHMLNPSPIEIKDLELLPTLVEVACNPNIYKEEPGSLPLTPTAASIALIETLVTAFDYVTNNMHLAAISSPNVLSRLMTSSRDTNIGEGTALAAILVRCMRLNENCRKFLSQVTPMEPFLRLMRSNEKRAKLTSLKYFQEILRMPRSSAINLLHHIQEQGSINIMHTLMTCMQQTSPECRLLAANLMLQLDLLEDKCGRSVFREEAIEVLMESVACEEESDSQILSSSILSNLGGTFTWTGEAYTAAWLVKKTGLKSSSHRNMIKNYDWSDSCLQDAAVDTWCSKTARCLIKTENSIFDALEKGLQSKTKGVARDCLITIAWIGCEVAVMGPCNLRSYACETLLKGISHFLHPGIELDERLLACMSVYNYVSGKGMQRLMNFSEGTRESLRRLSSVSWMAEELLKVTDYLLPTKPRVSCVHTQILEASHTGNGSTTALIFYKGHLCSGYSDGSIKVWDIKGQTAKLAWDVKEHKKAVTCFALFEPRESLLSGSSDKTIRVWQLVQRKLECVEVIEMKEPINIIDSFGQLIFIIAHGRGLKVCHPSRTFETICKHKHVKCLAANQGKIYLGCSDSSIQEFDIATSQRQEIRAPTKGWSMQNRTINSIFVYKNWVYSSGATVEGLNFKELKRCNQSQAPIVMARRTNVQEMVVVEDFVYLSCISSPSILQIWLRGKQQKVGRLSAGSRITSLLTANDIVLCGTENGSIKGWIPL
ncbi:putative E3 ubiquitin-protein ligase LIN-1 [Acorus gramineus]|uniref:E3 ubiquitin-protein ligase LIN-1 n=1 Tax=Acorus gramineus TaxID=55184 RepID=A0AAV9BR48_ACOGR|nr:putative E3 ubiquitin-protein ligase LIN-1 [Acorus gramineus]